MIDQSYRNDFAIIYTPLPTPEQAKETGRRYAVARPVVDLCRCSTREALIRTVVQALNTAGLPAASLRFQARAAKATGPNGLAQIAGDYVRLVRSM